MQRHIVAIGKCGVMLGAFVDDDDDDEDDKDNRFKQNFQESALHIFFRLPPIVLERGIRRPITNKWNKTRDHLKVIIIILLHYSGVIPLYHTFSNIFYILCDATE